MSNFRSTNDIKVAVLKRCGEMTDGTSSYDADAVTYMNSVYRGLVSGGNEFGVDCGEPWIWATASTPQLITLLMPFNTGTVSVTNNSATITFSSAPTVSLTGYRFRIDNRADYFTITAHSALATTATIDMAYPDATGSGLTFVAMKLQYQLTTALNRFVGPFVCFHNNADTANSPEQGKIYEVDLLTFQRKFPLQQLQASIPDHFCVVARTVADLVTVEFNGYPDPTSGIPTRIEVPYIPVVADLVDSTSDYPLVPLGFRDILLHGAAYYIMLDKSDNRAETEAMLAKTKLQALINHNRKELTLAGSSFGRIVTRQSPRRRYLNGFY